MKVLNSKPVERILEKTTHPREMGELITDTFSTLDKFIQDGSVDSKYISILREFVRNNKKYQNTKFKSIAGRGLFSVVFDIGNNEVLKLTKENPYQYRKYVEGLDVPLLDFNKFNDFYILKEAKAVTGKDKVNEKHYYELLQNMCEHGLEPSLDYIPRRLDQIGLIDNKPVLLDSRCAVPRPNKFTLFVERFSEIHRKRKLTLRPNQIIGAPIIDHVDESPRKNINIYQGSKKIMNTIADNIQYYFMKKFNIKNDKFLLF